MKKVEIGGEKRCGNDRRSWQSMPAVPFVDSNGQVVLEDRRKIADRRLDNIEVEWKRA